MDKIKLAQFIDQYGDAAYKAGMWTALGSVMSHMDEVKRIAVEIKDWVEREEDTPPFPRYYLIVGPNDETIAVHVASTAWSKLYEAMRQGVGACEILNKQGYMFSAHNGWMAPKTKPVKTLHIADRGGQPDIVVDYTMSDNGAFRYAWDKNLAAARMLKGMGYVYELPVGRDRDYEGGPFWQGSKTKPAKVEDKPRDSMLKRNYGVLMQAIGEHKDCIKIMQRAKQLLDESDDDI